MLFYHNQNKEGPKMKAEIFFYIQLFLITTMSIFSAGAAEAFEYVSPKPNSILVSGKTNIILRAVKPVDASTLDPSLIQVEGAKSGTHAGDLILSDDGRTLVFNPYVPFAPEETVKVTLKQGIIETGGTVLSEYSFTFETAPEAMFKTTGKAEHDDLYGLGYQPAGLSGQTRTTDVLPAPVVTVDSVDNPAPGYIFLAAWDRNVPHIYANYIFVLNGSGQIVDSVRVNGAPFDFKVQPNGLLSYALGDFGGVAPLPEEELQHMILDENLAVVDSFKMKNGYITDFHEFLMLPNGHVMMMSYHYITYDMSTIVPGGRTDASLVINIIQEQDRDKNVVFEWRNIDYIPITDSDLNLTDPRINYSTLNAFDVDNDGNILASFRNHSEIMKISRETGEIMWRWGSPRGEFTFIGEHEENAPYYFARQHDIRRLDNGNVSLFDNGEFHNPPYSRSAEYQLDEVNKVATLVSEHRYPNGNIIAAAAGNAQKLPGGDWFLCYGILNPQSPVQRNVVEYHADGSVALEISLPKNVIAYRSHKMLWKELVKKPSVSYIEVLQGNTYEFNNSTDTTGVSIYYDQLTGDSYNTATITRVPYGPVNAQYVDDLPIVYPVSFQYDGAAITSQSAELHISLDAYPEIKKPGKTAVFHRLYPNKGLFVMLATAYDSVANELIATAPEFGEFVFGETDLVYLPQPPILYEPANGKKVLAGDSLALRWTGKGFYDRFQVQVSTDSMFGSVLIDESLKSSFLWFDGPGRDTTCYWRVRAILGSDESGWSAAGRFTPANAFIGVTSPNGGEVWSKGDNAVIRWETNIADSVKIALLLGDQNISTIGNVPAGLNAFTWNISTDLAADSTYKIQITSMNDSSISDISDDDFALEAPSNVEAQENDVPAVYALFQNYPNPFNPVTTIKFSVPGSQKVTIQVCNILGQTVATLLDKPVSAGEHEVKFDGQYLPSGIYFYRMEAAGGFQSVKKMILLK
jgi:hypothetical protein